MTIENDFDRKRRRIEDTPLARGVEMLVNDINERALDDKGEVKMGVGIREGEGVLDTIFTLDWEGAKTKRRGILRSGRVVLTSGNPFHIHVSPFQNNPDGFLQFRVTANYQGPDTEDIEVGMTNKLDLSELKELLETQIDMIRQSSQRSQR